MSSGWSTKRWKSLRELGRRSRYQGIKGEVLRVKFDLSLSPGVSSRLILKFGMSAGTEFILAAISWWVFLTRFLDEQGTLHLLRFKSLGLL